ncbi:DUF4465 domain-containing protein [Zavarzinella formosa]|uniref:DUF4465 domain-containing protein n=1 Tax=Zavarzinella formosa TaxID=360055 RepID=UPI0002D300BD|nr:DUF4465 domain-containing protein [Zavarzinella formosa]
MRKKIKSVRTLLRLDTLEDRTVLTGPYAPAAGLPGSTALSKDDTAFVGWATGYQNYVVGPNVSASFQTPLKALGKATGSTTDIVSLGDGGTITLTFDRPIANGPGADFATFENSFNDTFLELGFVEVSSDGSHFVRFPNHSLTPNPVGGFGAVDPTNIDGYIGKYRVGYGTPFDLEELDGVDPLLDVNSVKYVRIVDITGNGSVLDTSGHPIYDPYPTSGSGGIDLEAIGVLNYRPQTAHFEDVGAGLADKSYFNGPDPSGTQGTGPFGDQVVSGEFQSGGLRFNNNYSLDYGSWSGWAYSNTTDTTTAGFGNQFSAYPGSGAANSRTYAVAFDDVSGSSPPPTIERTAATEGLNFQTLWISNTTYDALSMRNGDQFAKKFGGATGNDPDFLLLTITGKDSGGAAIGTLDFYLADYRFADNSLDYIVDKWTPVDVSSLGNAASLEFSIAGSDVGAFGLNTPSYFALDNVAMEDVTPPTVISIDDGDDDDTVVENTKLKYTVKFSEPLARGSFTAADLDNAGTASISIGAITEVSAGTYTVEVTPTTAGTLILRIPGGAAVKDLAGNALVTPFQDDTTVTATVNNPPTVANAIPDQTFTGPGPQTFQFASDTFNDADGNETLTYSATLADGAPLPAWLTFTPATRTFSGNPSAGDITPLQIRVTTDDGNGGSVFDDFQLTLTNVNDTPTVVNAIPDQTFTGSGSKSFQFAANTFADADAGDVLSYSATLVDGAPLPAWLTFTPATRTFSGNPGVTDNSPLQIRVKADDSNGGTDTEDFQLTLVNVNDTPTVANTIPSQTFTGPGAHAFQFAADTFADGDAGDSLAISATLMGGAPLPAWLTFTPATRTFSGNPGSSDTSPLQIRVTADDGNGGNVSADFQLTLTNVNDAPTVANTIPDQTFSGPGPKAFQFAANTFADADAGDVLSYNATLADGNPLPAWLTFTPATRTFSGNPSPSDVTPLQVRVTADDGRGGNVFDDFQLTLVNVNDPPTTTGIANVTVDEDAPDSVIDLRTAFADTEDGAAGLIYTVHSNTNAAMFASVSINASTNELTLGYSPNAFGSADITIRATDVAGVFVDSAFTVTVNPVNDAPVASDDTASGNEDEGIISGNVLTNDNDIDSPALTVGEINGLAGNVGNEITITGGKLTVNSNGSFSFTPNSNFNGSTGFTYKATDGMSLSNLATVTITVNAVNDAPVNTLPAATLSVNIGQELLISGLSISDPDVDTNTGTFVVVLSVTTGKLSVITNDPNASSVLTLTGTVGQINASLAAGVCYQSPAASATATLTMVTNDLGNVGIGGLKTDTDTKSITVNAPVTHLTLSAPASSPAGVPFQVTFTARDINGDVVTGYNGPITLTSSDTQAALDSVIFNHGVGTFQTTLKTAGNQTITATVQGDPTLTTTSAVMIAAGAATQIAFVQMPVAGIVGVPLAPALILQVRDAFNNPVNVSEKASVRLLNNPSAATLGGTTSVNLVNGMATLSNLTVSKAGTGYTFLVSTATLPGIVSPAFDVLGTIKKFLVTPAIGSPASPITAGTTITYNVRAVTAANQVVDYDGMVKLGSTDKQAVLPGSLALTNGIGSFTVQYKTAGRYAVTVADLGKGTIKGVTAALTVNPQATPARFSVIGTPLTTGDKPYKVTVTALDAFDNVVKGYTGTVRLTSDGPATLPAGYTFVAKDGGKKVFTITPTTPGVQIITVQNTAASPLIQGTVQTRALPYKSAFQEPGGDLVIGGTAGADTIRIRPANVDGTQVLVFFGTSATALPLGPFTPTGKILIYGLAGNDTIKLEPGAGALAGVQMAVPMVIDGDVGNDTITLTGSSANNVVVGGAGNDKITGGSGRDILLGGLGRDTLMGGAGDDILVADSSPLETNQAGLLQLMAEWGNTSEDYLTRQRRLIGSLVDGANSPTFLNSTTVNKDGVADQLFGEAGLDWFVFSTGDLLKDLQVGELQSSL